jgi:flavin reductase (DIM6/NTAB) family NADH-FMN oxidoreductase RutF
VAISRVPDDWTGVAAGESASAAALRQTMADFASGVTIVTTQWQGVAHAMTATAFCSVSLDPPLVLVCVSKTSRFHQAVTQADGWAVSLLSGPQETIARHFANRGRDLRTQFDLVPHSLGPTTGAPVIDRALAWLECATYAKHDGGDHTILVGQVLLTSDQPSPDRPLTYYRGSYSPTT